MPTTRATFTRMQDGTARDYQIIEAAESVYFARLPDRILEAVAALGTDGLDGYPVDRTTHSLQSATRALGDGREPEYVVAALVHDLGDPLAPFSHGSLAAAILRPFVSPRIVWVIDHHPLFQTFYYAPHLGAKKEAREIHRGHQWFDDTVEFCERYDENCFDPDYQNLPLEAFAPLVHDIFGRPPTFPETASVAAEG